MNITIGDRQIKPLDIGDQDMGVGGADIILNHEPAAIAHRIGGKTGMTEFEN